MPGIVTSTGGSGSVKTYRALFTSTSTSVAINWVSGTSSGVGTVNLAADKGVLVTFQNQSTVANATIGGPDLTANAQGIVLGTLTTASTNIPSSMTIFTAGSFSGIQMGDWYVTSTATGAVVATLLKGV